MSATASPLRRPLAAAEPAPLALVLYVLSAIGVAIAGYEHAHLWHQGYGDVGVVGPLFFLNGIASAVVILLLLARRAVLFAAGALAISLGSVVSILISHSSRFFGYAEAGYDPRAKLILVAEIAAAVLALAGLAADAVLGGRRR